MTESIVIIARGRNPHHVSQFHEHFRSSDIYPKIDVVIDIQRYGTSYNFTGSYESCEKFTQEASKAFPDLYLMCGHKVSEKQSQFAQFKAGENFSIPRDIMDNKY